MAPHVTIDLSRLRSITNPAFWQLYGAKERYVNMIGGGGSGKSVYASQNPIFRLMTEPDHFWGSFRKVHRTCYDSVFAAHKSAIRKMGVADLWQENKSRLTLTFKPNGNRIICLGLDDPEKIKSITDERGRDINLTGAWLEEATEMNEMDFVQIDLRLRGGRNKKQILLSYNPISHHSWIKRRFFDNPQDRLKIRIHRSTWRDNVFLRDPDYVEQLQNLRFIDEQLWRVYSEGLWGMLKGLIYGLFPYADPPATIDDTFYGLDFGFNNPMVLVRCDLRDEKIFISESIYRSSLTTTDLISVMLEGNISQTAPIYADPSEPGIIEELARAGYNVRAAEKIGGPNINEVKAGIMFVKAQQIFTSPGNTNINKELGAYKWKETKDGNLLDEPVKFMDHAMDAIRYAIVSHLFRRQAAGVMFL